MSRPSNNRDYSITSKSTKEEKNINKNSILKGFTFERIPEDPNLAIDSDDEEFVGNPRAITNLFKGNISVTSIESLCDHYDVFEQKVSSWDDETVVDIVHQIYCVIGRINNVRSTEFFRLYREFESQPEFKKHAIAMNARYEKYFNKAVSMYVENLEILGFNFKRCFDASPFFWHMKGTEVVTERFLGSISLEKGSLTYACHGCFSKSSLVKPYPLIVFSAHSPFIPMGHHIQNDIHILNHDLPGMIINKHAMKQRDKRIDRCVPSVRVAHVILSSHMIHWSLSFNRTLVSYDQVVYSKSFDPVCFYYVDAILKRWEHLTYASHESVYEMFYRTLTFRFSYLIDVSFLYQFISTSLIQLYHICDDRIPYHSNFCQRGLPLAAAKLSDLLIPELSNLILGFLVIRLMH